MQGLVEDVVLRPRSSRVLAVGVVLVAAVPFVGLLVTGRFDLLVRAAAPLALLGLGGWALFWRPAVRVGPAAVAFVNPLKTVEVTWPAVQDVKTQWSLALVTAHGTYTAWAAPRPTRLTRGFAPRRDRYSRIDLVQRSSPREAPRATGDLAAMLVERQWGEYRDRGLLGAVEGTGVTVHWHVATAIAAVVLVVCWVLGVSLA